MIEGYDVVKKIEDQGTNSGKPKDGIKVEIADCGLLPAEPGDAPKTFEVSEQAPGTDA